MEPKPRREWRPSRWLPLRVLRLARRVGVTPWEALQWLEDVLEDFESQAAFNGAQGSFPDTSGDGLPWPPIT